ncbi:MAG: DUF192 domain-containing protein [Bacteroidota bacterium]
MAKSKKSQKKKVSLPTIIGVGVLVVLLVLGNVKQLSSLFNKPQTAQKPRVTEPQFKKEGELDFISQETGNVLQHIDIEVAENDAERTQGLMFRKSMDENRGMLFIFQQEEVQAFWMRNTLISLDIIYVNAALQIVKIQRRTQPLSEVSLTSDVPAKYVVEVVGGYCTQYGIQEGDQVKFIRS